MNQPETPRCETCRHWNTPDAYDEGLGRCSGIRERWEVKNAPFDAPGAKGRSDYDDWDEVEAIEEKALAAANAVVIDGSGYIAALLTRPGFCCSEHTPKETPDAR